MSHRRTDPACVEHRPPRTALARRRFNRARGRVCWDCRGNPHPLDDPECPEHRVADSSAPASEPDARTVWCKACKGPHDVVEEGPEGDPDGWEWWVVRLDCGHEEATREANR